MYDETIDSTPQYPSLVENITKKGFYPKLKLADLMRLYDEYTELGCYVVPKQ